MNQRMSVQGLWRGGTVSARRLVGRREIAGGVPDVIVAAQRNPFGRTPRNGMKEARVVSRATPGDSFFFKPSRGGGDHMESATPENSELVRIIAKLKEGEKGRVLAVVSSDAKKAIAVTVANTFGFVAGKGLEVSVRGAYFPFYAFLFSCLCAGYSLRATEARMHLEGFLKPSPQPPLDDDDYFEKASGLLPEVRAKLPAEAAGYIASLEAQVEDHERAKKRDKEKKASSNPLTEYVLSVGPEKILQMTASSSLEVTGAFNSVAGRVLEKFGAPPLKVAGLGEEIEVMVGSKALMDAVEWCLLTGYFVRYEESRIALDKCFSKEDAEKPTDGSPCWLSRIKGFLGKALLGRGNRSN